MEGDPLPRAQGEPGGDPEGWGRGAVVPRRAGEILDDGRAPEAAARLPANHRQVQRDCCH